MTILNHTLQEMSLYTLQVCERTHPQKEKNALTFCEREGDPYIYEVAWVRYRLLFWVNRPEHVQPDMVERTKTKTSNMQVLKDH